MLKYPTDAFVNVTYNCNARCIMCDVWRKPRCEELEPAQYIKLPSSLVYINISGGEPFLRRDLPEVIQAISEKCRRAKIDISTNGLSTDMIEKSVEEIMGTGARFGIRVSVDGIGETHDKIRGIKGAFERAITTIKMLKEMGIKDIGIACIATNENLDDILNVIGLAKKLRVDFTWVGVPNSSELTIAEKDYNIRDLEKLRVRIDSIVKGYLKSFKPRNWVRAYVHSGTYYYAITRRRRIPCFAGTDFFFMDPLGDIYPDMVLSYKFGNIKEQSFDEIWSSQRAIDFRRKIEDVGNCPHQCWMLCTVWPHMRRNKLSCALWIFMNKLKSHLHLPFTPIQ